TAAAVPVRVGVLLGRPAVGGPARVAETEGPLDRREPEVLLEVAQLAGAAHDLDGVAVDDRDARGIVAAVLQAPQAVEEDGADPLAPDVPDDPAHDGLNNMSADPGPQIRS